LNNNCKRGGKEIGLLSLLQVSLLITLLSQVVAVVAGVLIMAVEVALEGSERILDLLFL
jgi:hypothetical protein